MSIFFKQNAVTRGRKLLSALAALAKDDHKHFFEVTGARLEIAKLLKQDLDVKQQNKRGQTAAHIALKVDRFDLFMRIVEKGADVRMIDMDGDSAMTALIRMGSSHNLYQFLDRHPDTKITPIDLDHIESAEMLGEQRAKMLALIEPFYRRDNDGQFPVHLTITDRHRHCAVVLHAKHFPPAGKTPQKKLSL